MDDKRIQTVPITTNVVSLNPAQGKMYSMQTYVITFDSDIRQVGGVLQVLLFPPLLLTVTFGRSVGFSKYPCFAHYALQLHSADRWCSPSTPVSPTN